MSISEKMSENEKMLKHFLTPLNVGTMKDADGYCRGINPINGYITEIYLKIEEDKIIDIKFKTNGCVVTIASTSAISNIVKGRRLSDIIKSEKSFEELAKLLTHEIGEIPDKNWHCIPTVIQTLYTAILNYFEKKENVKKVKHINKINKNINCYVEERKNRL